MDRSSSIKLICKILNPEVSTSELEGSFEHLTPTNWGVIQQVAAEQGLTLLLYERFNILSHEQGIPPAFQAILRKAYLEAIARNVRMLHHAEIILQALKAQNLDVIALKGLYLAEAIYSSIGLRIFGDLDLLVRKKDIAAALDVMQEIGYQLETYYNPATPNLDIKHIPPMIKKDGPYVEVHWSILEENEPFIIDMDGIWQRAVPANVAGVDVLALDLEDLVLHLCVHFTYQHRLKAGLKFLFDISKVMHKSGGQIDWQKLVATAKNWSAERVVWLTFQLLDKILGVSCPAEVLQQLMPEQVNPAVLEEAIQQVLSTDREGVNLTPDLAALAVEGNFGGRVGLILSRIFIPRRVMARLYNVNPNSVFIYLFYPVRFCELYQQYASSTWRIIAKEKNAVAELGRQQANNRLREWMIKGV